MKNEKLDKRDILERLFEYVELGESEVNVWNVESEDWEKKKVELNSCGINKEKECVNVSLMIEEIDMNVEIYIKDFEKIERCGSCKKIINE